MIRALEGLRVVDFAEGIAGPFMGKLMAGLGAEVIKVELPDGDAARRVGPFPGDTPDPESSGLYLYLNTGKKGITVDPARGPDAALITDLISSADVIIECFSPGWLESQELGYPTSSAANSGLVMVSITPFGQTGPYSAFAAPNMANEIPVLPLVASRMTLPGLRRPLFSPCCNISRAARSLTDPHGLNHSALA